MIQGSKAKYIRDLLDKSLELSVPDMSPEHFERVFGMKVTADEIKNLSFGEVMVRQLVLKACVGNDKSIQEVLDRLLGKPMQTTENVTKSYTYHDFLFRCQELDEKDAGAAPRTVIEAAPAPLTPPSAPPVMAPRAAAPGTALLPHAVGSAPSVKVAGGREILPGDPLYDLI